MNKAYSFWLTIGTAIGTSIGVATNDLVKSIAWGALAGVVLATLIHAQKRNMRTSKMNHKKK